jgi:cardiolipin synthase
MSLNWLPNAISFLRIVLVVPILLLILDGAFGWALLLFFIAGFSDGIDGYLAKRYNWHTRLGGLLDPVADKLLVNGLFITMASMQLVPLWLAAVVILRDVIIIGGAAAYNFFVEPLQGEPSRISKLNTVFELLFLLFVLSRAAFHWPDKISLTVLGSAILITVVISGVDYVWSWSKRARAGG